MRHSQILQVAKEPGATVGVVLDGFDEAQSRIPQLGRLLAKAVSERPMERLCLRISSRSVNWSLLLEAAIRESCDDVEVVELLPLRRADAALIAAELCDDPAGLLSAVDAAGASAFASRLQTLRMLARSYAQTGRLAPDSKGLYDAGIRALVEEQSEPL